MRTSFAAPYRSRRFLLAVASAIGLTVAMVAPTAATASQSVVSNLTEIVSGLNQPVFVTNAGDDRLFVVERPGKIVIVKDVSGTWQVTGTFLNMTSRVNDGDTEQGLLGLAFHPDYATNGLFYVYYTNSAGNEVLAEYHRASLDKADPNSYREVLHIQDPFTNHNGGWLAFKGPYLYIAEGDGGSGGDPYGNGQNKDTRLGKILRIDPLDPPGPRSFSIPASNPFVGKPGRDAIWAYGLRNAWRDSFDPLTGDLWIGDVGQDRYEEIDHAGTARGKNFGWNLVEGRHLYPSGALCQTDCKTLPIIEYPHAVSGGDNCAVTGGYVSRRTGADLYGNYIFGDFCSGRIWTVPADYQYGDPMAAPYLSGLEISSFGEDSAGHIFVVDLGGSLWQVDGT